MTQISNNTRPTPLRPGTRVMAKAPFVSSTMVGYVTEALEWTEEFGWYYRLEGFNVPICEQCITPDPRRARFQYKGFTCIWSKRLDAYEVFTAEEMEQPAGMRYPDMECGTEDHCKQHIDSWEQE